MAANHFFRKDYPDFLKKELESRFTLGVTTNGYEPNGEGPLGSTIELETWVWDNNAKDYTAPGAYFEAGRLVNFGAGKGSSARFADPAPSSYIPNEIRAGRGYNYEELLRITGVKIDVGGRVGSLSKCTVSFEMRGKKMQEKFNEYVTQIGARLKLTIEQYWKSGAIAIGQNYPDANKLVLEGRVFNFKFSYKGNEWWEGSIDTVGLAEALTSLNVLSSINPNGNGYPSAWPKTTKIKDTSETSINCDNLLYILFGLWDQQLEGKKDDQLYAGDWQKIPGITTLTSNPGSTFICRGTQETGGWFSSPDAPDTDGFTRYITLEGFRAVLQKCLEVSADQSNNKIAKKIKIFYPTIKGNQINIGGPVTDYLHSSDPEKILFFNKEVHPYDISSDEDEYFYHNKSKTLMYSTRSPFARWVSPNGDITNILLSKALIIEAMGAELGSTWKLPPGGKSIEDIFEKIFETIKTCTGGIIDLELAPDISDISEENAILVIRDRNHKNASSSDEDTYPIGFAIYSSPQRHYIEKDVWSFSAEVPKSLQTKSFVRDANLVAKDTQQFQNGEEQLENSDINDTLTDLPGQLRVLRRGWPRSDVRSEDTQKMQELLSTLYNANISNEEDINKKKSDLVNEASRNRNIQTALKLGMKTFGINGWKWGHVIAIEPNAIPSTSPKNIAFIITKISHDIKSSANGSQYQWETTLDCKTTIVPVGDLVGINYLGA